MKNLLVLVRRGEGLKFYRGTYVFIAQKDMRFLEKKLVFRISLKLLTAGIIFLESLSGKYQLD